MKEPGESGASAESWAGTESRAGGVDLAGGENGPLGGPARRGLIVVSSVARLPGGRQAGFWLPEAAYPWRALTSAGWDFAFAGTREGTPTIGGVDRSDLPQRLFLDDGTVRERLAATTTADRCTPADFGIVLIAGGHGAMLDLPEDPRLAGFLTRFHTGGGVVVAVCHGVAALLPARAPGGAPLVAGRRVTGFSRAEEEAAGLAATVPFFLDEALRERGARYEAGEPFAPHVVRDGNLVTGQNPASAAEATALGMRLALGRALPGNWLIGHTGKYAGSPRSGTAENTHEMTA
ncbi:type 1 glutamine amidotransferase domain-containing protein [Streptomyces sp. NPDC056987]|uniref:type 1 glutamine amidotransferase domain-containing protein n=1 Tax=Streptomyces sp. NPDC056987 TaxID=3345988 RepID=UPI0036345C8F